MSCPTGSLGCTSVVVACPCHVATVVFTHTPAAARPSPLRHSVEDDLFFYETPFVQRRLLDSEDDDGDDDAATAAHGKEQARRKEQAQRAIHDDDDD